VKDFLNEKNKNAIYIIGGCDPRMQRKMFKDVFAEKGLDIDKQVIPLDLRNMETEGAMKKVAEAVEKVKSGGNI